MFKFIKILNKQTIYSILILLFIGITITLVWGLNKTSILNSEKNNESSTISSTNQKTNNSTEYVSQKSSSIKLPTPSAIQASATSPSANTVTTQTPAAIDADSEKYSKASKAIFAGAKKMQVSITFDDGYDRTAIKKVLDVLKEENLKATFFVIGKNLNNNTDLWKRAVKEGHEICNHTYYHQLLGKMSNDKIIKEITDWEEAAEKVLGKEYLARMKQDFPFIRLPGGDGNNNKRILYLAQSQGYKVIGWDTDSYTGVIRQMVKDKQPKDVIGKQVSVYIPKAAKKGSIILMHFNSYDTPYLKQTIKGLKDKGYEIKSVSEIIKN